jgi:uncharacterized protein with PQ loop repeat
VADIGLIWQVIYYQQCTASEAKCDEDEAIALLKQKTLKQRRTSSDTHILEKQSSLVNNLDDSDTDLISNVSDQKEKDIIDHITINQPSNKSNSVYVSVIGSSVLIGLVLASLYGYIKLTSTIEPDDTEEIRLLPQILGWFSAVLYVGSRVPQLIKNWRQQSTEGLSPGMFICAVFGNLFYALVSRQIWHFWLYIYAFFLVNLSKIYREKIYHCESFLDYR